MKNASVNWPKKRKAEEKRQRKLSGKPDDDGAPDEPQAEGDALCRSGQPQPSRKPKIARFPVPPAADPAPMPRQLFVTTALPYANAGFHIGHIMEYTQADIWVRFQRMAGSQVHFVCADDAHGAPIMIAAEKAQQDAAGVRRGHCSGPQAVPRRLSHQLRQLALHRRRREP